MLLALALLPALAAATRAVGVLETVPEVPYGVALIDGNDLYCESWKFSVENNDAGIWKTIPPRCVEFVENYMNGPRYAADSDVVTDESIEYARSLPISRAEGKDVWIFDIDETLLSNLPYYVVTGYGHVFFLTSLF